MPEEKGKTACIIATLCSAWEVCSEIWETLPGGYALWHFRSMEELCAAAKEATPDLIIATEGFWTDLSKGERKEFCNIFGEKFAGTNVIVVSTDAKKEESKEIAEELGVKAFVYLPRAIRHSYEIAGAVRQHFSPESVSPGCGNGASSGKVSVLDPIKANRLVPNGQRGACNM